MIDPHSLVVVPVGGQGESVRAGRTLYAGAAVRQMNHSGHGHRGGHLTDGVASPIKGSHC